VKLSYMPHYMKTFKRFGLKFYFYNIRVDICFIASADSVAQSPSRNDSRSAGHEILVA
jgi:hypothetical protein